MRSSKLFIFILRLILGPVIVLVIWNPLVNLTFTIAQGQDPAFDLGDNYELWSWPGYIVYRPPTKESWQFERIIHPERTVEFLVKNPWIIGRTEKGWFAINKETHQLYYPYSSKTELQTITGFDISSLDTIIDYPSSYEILQPGSLAAKTMANRVCWVLIFVLPILLGFGPYIWRGLATRRQKQSK